MVRKTLSKGIISLNTGQLKSELPDQNSNPSDTKKVVNRVSMKISAVRMFSNLAVKKPNDGDSSARDVLQVSKKPS